MLFLWCEIIRKIALLILCFLELDTGDVTITFKVRGD